MTLGRKHYVQTQYHAASTADNFEIVNKHPKSTHLDKGNEKSIKHVSFINYLLKNHELNLEIDITKNKSCNNKQYKSKQNSDWFQRKKNAKKMI